MKSLHDQIENIRREIAEREAAEVRIALFGKSGVGKSSLINRLTGQKLAIEGVRTDTTREVQFYQWNGLTLVDLPGYSTQRVPAQDYICRFGLEQFDLFLCVLADRILEDDIQLYTALYELGKPCLFVRNKQDQIWQDDAPVEELMRHIEEDFREQGGGEERLHFVSCRTLYGLPELEEAIYGKLQGFARDQWALAAKAYGAAFLAHKRKVCGDWVKQYSLLAAANGLNPIPGANIAVDIGLLLKLFEKIRLGYGLTPQVLAGIKTLNPTMVQIGKNVLEFATQQGVTLLLKRLASRLGARTVARLVPVVGQAVGVGLGYAATYKAGMKYRNDCHAFAEGMLGEGLTK